MCRSGGGINGDGKNKVKKRKMLRWKVFQETKDKLIKMPKLSLKQKDRFTMNADLQRYSYYAFVFQKMDNIK